MTVSAEFLDFARELFSGIGHVRSRAMFGGVSLYADDLIFAILAEDVVYLKVDDDLGAELEALGCEPLMFTPKSGEPKAMSYRRLPEEALDDEATARDWGRRALDVALKAKR
ncbi:MAG: TfoX/Sxy family protein [Oceanicaulis sp.]